MSQPQDDLYFLTNEAGNCYYDNNGMVDVSTSAIPIEEGPDGWLTKSIKYARNITWFGLFRTFSTPLKFVGSAAKIVRTRLYTKGTEDKIYLLIFKLDKSFGGGWIHKFFYKGELDLTQSDDEETNISANIMEGDLVKLFNANVNTTYEIPIDGPMVYDDGILLFETAAFVVLDDVNLIFGTNPNGIRRAIPLVKTAQEGVSAGIVFSNQANVFPNGAEHFAENTTTVTNPVTININLKGHLRMVCTEGTGADMHVYFSPDINITATYIDVFAGPVFTGGVYDIPINLTIPLDQAEQLTLQIHQNSFGSSVTSQLHFTVDDGFTVDFSNRFTTSYTPTLTPMAAGQALLDKLAGPGYTFESDLLSTTWDNLVITSGDAIRGIDGAVLKTSMSDFVNSYNVRCNLSLTIKDKVLKVERKAAAFDSTLMPTLGEVTKFIIKPATDHEYAGVQIGYPDLDTHSFQSLNAKEEFNVASTFTGPVTRTSKVLNLVSKYKASMYEQELARINLDGLKTTSDSNDNSVFFKLLEKNSTAGTGGQPPVYYKYFRDTYDSVTGLADPDSAYNIPLSPKNCLLEHGNYLRSVFYWYEGFSLVFQTSTRNATLVTVKAGVTISEGTDENIGSLDPPLFIPLNLFVDSPMPNGQIDTMNTNPAGTLPFSYNGKPFYGFVNELSIQPASKAVQTSNLLCSPLTDITTLINRDGE